MGNDSTFWAQKEGVYRAMAARKHTTFVLLPAHPVPTSQGDLESGWTEMTNSVTGEIELVHNSLLDDGLFWCDQADEDIEPGWLNGLMAELAIEDERAVRRGQREQEFLAGSYTPKGDDDIPF
jgi:hypothetical protein